MPEIQPKLQDSPTSKLPSQPTKLDDAGSSETSSDATPPGIFSVRDNGFHVETHHRVFRMPACHTHSHVELNYFLTGSVTYMLGGRAATLEAGNFALFWAAVPHQTTSVELGSRYVCINVPLHMFLAARLSRELRSEILAGGMILSTAPEHIRAAQFESIVNDANSDEDIRLKELLHDEVIMLLRRLDITGWRDMLDGVHGDMQVAGGPLPKKVMQMAKFVADNATQDIDVAAVSEAVDLHPNYAMTLFRRVLGMTVSSYIFRHRIMNAQTLLVGTNLGNAAIAFESGFGSVSQFHRRFFDHFGCTPRAFRQRMAGSSSGREA